MNRSDLDGLGYRGKTVVLTGGSSGMGEATTRLLGDLGANVHIADIATPNVACAGYVPLDLGDPASIDAAAEKLKSVGPIDYLFPVAGIPPHVLGPLGCMLVNYAGTRQFTEAMISQVREGVDALEEAVRVEVVEIAQRDFRGLPAAEGTVHRCLETFELVAGAATGGDIGKRLVQP